MSSLDNVVADLRAGDSVLLSGDVFTARDAAHARLCMLLDAGQPLPFELRGAVIYYAGPTRTPPGRISGSCGPTTSSRMDGYTPRLLELGLLGMIGKGGRSPETVDAIVRHSAVYFCAVGGAGALCAKHITETEEIAFADLGCESIKRLTLERLPVIVGVDMYGGSVV